MKLSTSRCLGHALQRQRVICRVSMQALAVSSGLSVVELSKIESGFHQVDEETYMHLLYTLNKISPRPKRRKCSHPSAQMCLL